MQKHSGSILENYKTLQSVWQECLDEEKDPKTKGHVRGVESYMKRFDYLFGVKLGYLTIKHSNNLRSTVQTKDISGTEGHRNVQRIQ